MNFPIGIITDCFRTDIASALKKAADLGASGVQIYAVKGDISPEMSAEKRAELRDMVKGLIL